MRSLTHTRRACIVVILLLTSLSAVGQTQKPSSEETTEVSKIGAITGSVVNENGQPLPDASVSIRAFNSVGPGGGVITDRGGTFQLDGLDRVAYLVSASFPAYIA